MQPSVTGATPGEPATVDLSGRCVGNSYVLICPVGHGATGTVWRGIERSTGDQVAVKLLHEGLLRQPKLVTRFVQERTILMMVRHEHIVGVRDLFSVGESLALVMDFVAGGSLRDHLRAAGALAPAEAARLLSQVAAALAEAHALSVVHRDVKPDNILLQAADDGPHVRLTDFGIARVLDAAGLTTPNAIIGTPHYMAPETISGGDAGPAADVYALGVVLYELVCGRTPYAGEPLAVLRRHLDGPPDRPAGLPDAVWSVIRSCVDADPAARPAAADLATVLRDLARRTAGVPARSAPAPADGTPPALTGGLSPAPRPARRPPRNGPRSWVWARRGMLAVLAAGALAASGLGGYEAWRLRDTGGPSAGAAASPSAGAATATAGPSAPSASAAAPGARVVPPAPPPVPPMDAAGAKPAPAGSVPARPGGAAGPAGTAPTAAPTAPPTTGPWRCRDHAGGDLGHPVLAKPCYALGSVIHAMGELEAIPGVQADVSLSVRDADSGEVVAGPSTCAALMFTDFALRHRCGPVELQAPRGHRYVVVQSWRYTGRSLLPGGSVRSPEFTW